MSDTRGGRDRRPARGATAARQLAVAAVVLGLLGACAPTTPVSPPAPGTEVGAGPTPVPSTPVPSTPVPSTPAPTPSTAGPSPPDATPAPTVATPTTTPVADTVQAIASQMSDEELAGQLLVVSFRGTAAGGVDGAAAAANRAQFGVETPAQVIEAVQPAGVILMGHNTTGGDGRSSTVPPLVAGLQERAAVPLLVAIDQEHGPVARLGAPFTHFPSAMALGATGAHDLARRVSAAAGQELAAAGINVNLAPVADVNSEPSNPVIGVRSPGQGPAAVAMLVAAQVRGLQDDAGVAAAVKHFPGHGDTTRDSHDTLPAVDGSLDDLRTTALVPFRAAVRAGADLVMPGHLLLTDVDPDRPATLSPTLLQGVLRDELGFDGVVISDSMLMGAIRNDDDAATAVAGLRAGLDLVLMPPDALATRDAIVAAMADGTLDRPQVVQSVERVLTLKARRGILTGRDAPTPGLPDPALLAQHAALATEAGARAVTLLDGRCPAPLAGRAVTVTGTHRVRLSDALGAAGVTVAATAERRVVVWNGRGAAPDDAGAIVVVVGSPYAAGRVGSSASLLVTYGRTDATLRGLAEALASGSFPGRSPVSIPRPGAEPFTVGHGTTCN